MNLDMRGARNPVYLNDQRQQKKVWNSKRYCKFNGKPFNPIPFKNEGIYVEFSTFYTVYYLYETNKTIPEYLTNATKTYPIDLHMFLKAYFTADDLAYNFRAVEVRPFTNEWFSLMAVTINKIVSKIWCHTISSGYFEMQGLSRTFMRKFMFDRPSERDMLLNSWYHRITKIRDQKCFDVLFEKSERNDARILEKGFHLVIERLNPFLGNIHHSCFINTTYLTLECQPHLRLDF